MQTKLMIFTTDIWNIQFVLGVDQKGDKFLVKYKSNKGMYV